MTTESNATHTTLLTSDFDAILLQLARLAQFERMMLTALENDPLELLDVVMAEVRAEQAAPPYIPGYADLRPLETIDIPTIGLQVHQALHGCLDKQVCLNPLRVHAAVSTLIAILQAKEN
ncbi:MAG: hypothetical protein WA003_05930 [Desulfuromonadaceae bacterium]